MGLCAISISQLVLNEIAWSPGDPGTGAPSIFGDRRARPMRCGTTVLPKPQLLSSHPSHMEAETRPRGQSLQVESIALQIHWWSMIFSKNRLPLFRIML